MDQPTDPFTAELAAHVAQGLGSAQKFLSSKYFYDDQGSRLFQQIMTLPEYYLTRTEREILQHRGPEMARFIGAGGGPLDLIELGSGDGAKSLQLCAALSREGIESTYYAIDLSAHALAELTARFAEMLPDYPVRPLCGDYFAVWPELSAVRRHVGLFLGSNLGNFTRERSIVMLRHVRDRLRNGDILLLGVDLQKDPKIVQAAYSDSSGVTARFNLNLLARLNRELGMDFDPGSFHHYAAYNPLDGVVRSFLVSGREQAVYCRALERAFHFADGETIYTEQSQKYTEAMIAELALAAGYALERRFTDARNWYLIAALRASG